jgi:hypothetical protein
MAPRKITRTLPDRAARRNSTPSSSLTVEVPWPDEGSDIDPEYVPSDSDTGSTSSSISSGSDVELETESELDDDDVDEDEDEDEEEKNSRL